MFRLSQGTEIAVRGMIALAARDAAAARGAPVGSLAASAKTSPTFLAKVFQQLAHAGLVVSSRGKGGGFALARPASRITLLDLLQAMEGPLCVNQCGMCASGRACPAAVVWRRVEHATRSILAKTTIGRLAGGVAGRTVRKRRVS